MSVVFNTASVCLAMVANSSKRRLVFLGTPSFAASVLNDLFKASQSPAAGFEVVGVVTRPPNIVPGTSSSDGSKPGGEGKPSAVQLAAETWGLPAVNIFTPHSAREPEFLSSLTRLDPDLCVTAAYGNMLPQRFLDLPRLGTLNIHPSLLPKFRGPAPVQRAVLAGVSETGVSLAYTVLRCDAGPVLAQERVQVSSDEAAPELTARLFQRGARLLLQAMPSLLDGSATPATATPQDETQALHAPKVTACAMQGAPL
ncbi:uncharacterized protein HaLaN_01908 [Haematococcus lacustris]|uniref:methionyl-tRNA formyltransferase n=1 Tax=Haematococcus lacustris TaxID=44745 RepID=A0A699YAE3_HAELA|nr:uncharacterized protein HaLaN_01908 [Haematococcus lacustris]